MLGQRTLLINPPLVNGVAFTRQGRCQEREEVLGTTKPPYTLALLARAAARRRLRGPPVDATAARLSIDDVIARLDAEGFAPTLIVFPTTTPTLDADVPAMAKLKRRYGAPMFCFGPHASTAPAALDGRARRKWTACSSASPKTRVAAARGARLARRAGGRPEPDVRARLTARSSRTGRTAASPAS